MQAFYLCATPPALFFILYFETGSHEVVEGLTKQRERERQGERERETELRLAANPDPPSETLFLNKTKAGGAAWR